MDLSKIDVPDTAVIHIEHPTIGKIYADDKRKDPATITVYGPASDAAVAFKRKSSRKMADRLGKRGFKGLSNIPAEELEDMELDKLVAMTADVHGLENAGKPVTPETVDQLYRDPRYGWLRDQVAEKIGSWEDFLS